MKFIYFGTPDFSVIVLDELKKAGFLPTLIITSEDKPAGRKLVLTPSRAKVWAIENNIPFITPKRLRDESLIEEIRNINPDLSIVAAYGKLIPQSILDIPKKGTLNVHPSDLPLLRGPSPIESAISEGLTETRVSIIELDADMDHGCILAKSENLISWPKENPPKASELENMLAREGGALLAKTIPLVLNEKTQRIEQDHDKATFCKKITKEDGLVLLSDDPISSIRKIRAYDVWPVAYFFVGKNNQKIRVKITDAKVEDGKLIILKVIPEGKKEMNYQDFLRGLK